MAKPVYNIFKNILYYFERTLIILKTTLLERMFPAK